ncbi:GIY-YIG nuclease family protein [Paenibacillus ginsengarvi]|uniref:GIY-YIG domain-containing protein n=1 Tax=Paenibacillus ginsengarvi TaxID=400777 RepID=A0A3B0C2R3_9BACL|nr:GIY-YIG nuclease family protein [Paenibacillus ginsengarvi]RKN78814.1 hypothetical protein D7M11_22300 [Paenibacillus ginsengarvi]
MGSFTFVPHRYPEEPGCYLMFDRTGRLLYVGKAVNLRRRLCSYFHSKPDWIKVAQLVEEVADIEIMIVRNENESLTLETNLIQYYLPPYNRAKKRERSVFAYIAATQEKLPRLTALDRERQAPRTQLSGADELIAGPFPNPVFRNYALDFAIDWFKLRTCAPLEKRLCMRYYMEKCGGVCEQMETGEQYADRFREAMRLLSEPAKVPEEMEKGVSRLSERLQFEKAKELHVRLTALRSMLSEQAVNIPRDYHQLAVFFGPVYLLAARIDYGMLRTRFVWERTDWGERPEQIRWLDRLVSLLPDKGRVEVVTNDFIRSEPLVKAARIRGVSAKAVVPVKGVKRHILNLCERNMTYRVELECQAAASLEDESVSILPIDHSRKLPDGP